MVKGVKSRIEMLSLNLLHIHSLGKYMNSSLLLSATGNIEQTSFPSLSWQPV